jgi:hypothetical protein
VTAARFSSVVLAGAVGLLATSWWSCVLLPGQSYACRSDVDCLGLRGTRCVGDGDGKACNTALATNHDDDVTLAADGIPPTQWSRGAANAAGNSAYSALAVDSVGNTYAAGWFDGALQDEGTALTATGGRDLVMQSWDATGAARWAVRAGGGGDDAAAGLAVDNRGNVYLAGTFRVLADLEVSSPQASGPIIRQLPAEARCGEPQNLVVAAFSSDGTVRWVKTAGGASLNGNAITPDNSGGIVMAGRFSGSLDLGSGPMELCGRTGMFVAALNGDGSVRWLRDVPDNADTNSFTPYGIAAAADGSIAVVGDVAGNGEDPATDVFIARWDSQGQHLTTQRLGGAGPDGARAVAFTHNDGLAISGWFSSSMDLGALHANRQGPGRSMFVVGISTSGAGQFLLAVDGVESVGPLVPRFTGGVVLAGTAAGGTLTLPGRALATDPGAFFLAAVDVNGASPWGGVRVLPENNSALHHIKAMSLHPGGYVTLAGSLDTDAASAAFAARLGPAPTWDSVPLPAPTPPPSPADNSAPQYDAPSCTGDRWCWFSPHPQPVNNDMESVSGADGTTFWVTAGKDVLFFNGWRWLRTQSSPAPLHAVWAAPRLSLAEAPDVWAVGDQGTLRHNRGQIAWEDVWSPTQNTLHGVWGTSPSDVWAAGDDGALIHFDGFTWSDAASPVHTNLHAVTGDAHGNLLAVGEQGTVVARDTAGSYSATTLGDGFSVFNGACLAADGSAWVVGEHLGAATLWHGVQGVWSEYPFTQTPLPPLHACVALPDGNVFAAGDQGTMLRWVSGSWNAVDCGTSSDIRGLWGARSDNLLAVGAHGDMRLRTVTSDAMWSAVQVGTDSEMRGMFQDVDTWVPASDGLWRYSNRWQLLPIPGGARLLARAVGRTSMLMASDDSLYTLAPAGTEALVWRFVESLPEEHPGALWRDEGGTEWVAATRLHKRTDVNTWSSRELDMIVQGVFVDRVRSLLVGTHLDGSGAAEWMFAQDTLEDARLPAGTPALHAVAGTGPADIWAVGAHGVVLHWDGGGWNDLSVGDDVDLHAVYASPAAVRVGGEHGALFRYSATRTQRWVHEETGVDATLTGIGINYAGWLAVGQHGTAVLRNGATP